MSDDLQKSMEQNARQVSERLPEKYSVENHEIIVKAVESFVEQHNCTKSSISRQIGYSRSVVPMFMDGSYKGNVEKVANKLINLINSVNRKENRDKNTAFIETTIAKRIATLITQTEAFSETEGKIGVIVGDAGHGKTHCLKQYAEANKNAVYCELDNTASPTMMFAQIAKALRINSAGSLAAIAQRLVKTLKMRHLIIILDEASGLKVRTLDQLRQIVVTKGRCPLILAGNSYLLKTILQPSTKIGYESLDQFTSRLMQILNLDEIAGTSGGGLYTVQDVRKLYEFGGIKLTSGAVDKLRNICITPKSGRLRTCKHIVAALHTSQTVQRLGLINGEMIIAAIEQLDLPLKDRLPLAVLSDVNQNETIVAAAG